MIVRFVAWPLSSSRLRAQSLLIMAKTLARSGDVMLNASGRAVLLAADPNGKHRGGMADSSKFSIITYERKPGRWRAAITLLVRSGSNGSDEVRSTITPDDCQTELEAELAAQKLIRNL